MTVESKKAVYEVAPRLTSDNHPTPHYDTFEKYQADHKLSVTNPQEFWTKKANELLTWDTPFSKVLSGSLEGGDVKWFEDGTINACYNCVDRHALENPDKVALIYEADEPNQSLKVTYKELLDQICQLSNLLLSWGLKKGDSVAIYMPMVPQAIVSVMACARIGVLHSLVFAGFSAQSLSDRIKHADSKVLITSDEGKRGGKVIHLKKIADDAADLSPCLEKVLVYRHTKNPQVNFNQTRDFWWDVEVSKQSTECPHIPSNSEDPLFLLFTSGSTGAPKGIQHSTGGYLLGAAATTKYVFDTHPGDVFGCTADIGWITGHTYLTYGPLVLGLTTVIFESIPTYPDASRYWQLVDDHKITQFYTSPTAIRSLRRLGDEWVNKHHLETIRTIGSVGEPINPEAWEWYYHVVGKGQCALVDTYWQTETGSIIITPLPGATPTKPGSATFPFFGIDPVILDPTTGQVLEGNDVTGVLAIRQPWPSMARTVYKDHQRYLDTYFNPYKGFYFTGDGASRDHDGYIWIGGRVDDVINVSGHRLSTAEIESALILNPAVAEAAVVGIPDAVTGQSICSFVTLKPSHAHLEHAALTKELVLNVRSVIGPFAAPKKLIITEELPKTRSGKIIRRILRKIMSGEADSLGDLSTVSDPSVVDSLIQQVSHI
ncbi:putative acetyl-CoA synthetase [Conidiobolus coronatus NRRL 28638]|uniref:Acetyl-coenzyme A synthetase n=1 Tax=Conidiobolus coronatus (strain ATCC 28846 / CBS 209.66 / NRRL 28638) TaxID=796925 RepID=A0A137P1C3_CONC2|nr:putative acetyl-CoA synthetase [Conidiobolus coronatus NRRL 28638]|eukprot:KXN68837.1 putative acetyl-CoA synthetase [Conidiobolus coronatus NRRL 28638]